MSQAKRTALKSLLNTMKAMFRDMPPGHRKDELGKKIAAMEIELAKRDDCQE